MKKKANFVSKIKSLSNNDNFAVLSDSEARNIRGGKKISWEVVDGKLVLKLIN